MSDSITIPITLIQEARNALDAALSLANPHETGDKFNPSQAYSQVATARRNLVEYIGNIPMKEKGRCDNIETKLGKARRLAQGLSRILDEIENP